MSTEESMKEEMKEQVNEEIVEQAKDEEAPAPAPVPEPAPTPPETPIYVDAPAPAAAAARSPGNGAFRFLFMLITIAAILYGACMAYKAHTSNGSVDIRDIKSVAPDGAVLRSLLYIPKSATPQNKAPAVVSCHGFNNTAEVQDLNCVELSKRGYVVIAIDAYGHGDSTFADPGINGGINTDMGVYYAMQYLKTLPFVDTERVGLVGHSMGGTTIQDAALKALQAKADNPGVVVPLAVLPTAQGFSLDAEGKALFQDFPVNLGVVYGAFDEWAEFMWGMKKGSEIKSSAKAGTVMGFSGIEYDTYYKFGDGTALSAEEAVAAAKDRTLRVIFQTDTTHPGVHFNDKAVSDVVRFFDVTLKGAPTTEIAAADLSWFDKQIGTGISMAAFFCFVVAFALVLLKLPFFATIVQPEPLGITNSLGKRYWFLFILGILPAPIIFNYLVGYPIDMLSSARVVPIQFPASEYLPLPCVNGIYVMNLVIAAFSMVVYFLVFFATAGSNGFTLKNTGLSLSFGGIVKSAILAIFSFAAGYALLGLCDYVFKTDFRFFTFSIKPLILAKWPIYVRYLPSFLAFFLVSSMTLNTYTRVNHRSEFLNIILIVLGSCFGLLVLHVIDYAALFHWGEKIFLYVPMTPDGQVRTAALAGVLLWGLLVILPISAIMSRVLFKKTGSIWLGGFLNALVVTLYAMSNTVVAARVL